MAHVIWDWNGTLMADFPLLLASANSTLARFGGGVLDVDGYRSAFRRPINLFYMDLLGRNLSDSEWVELDQHFHEHYANHLHQVHLTDGAPELLAGVQRGGHTQSVLSMWFEDQLVPFIESRGVGRHFVRVDGRPLDAPSGSKTPHLTHHLQALVADGHEIGEIVMIGDTVDDAEAAFANGIPVVLYAGGEFAVDRLVATGAPVATSLSEALDLAGVRRH